MLIIIPLDPASYTSQRMPLSRLSPSNKTQQKKNFNMCVKERKVRNRQVMKNKVLFLTYGVSFCRGINKWHYEKSQQRMTFHKQWESMDVLSPKCEPLHHLANPEA